MSNSSNSKSKSISRRDFIAAGTLAGAGALLPNSLQAGQSTVAAMPVVGSRKRIAHVGTGSRARFYREAIVGEYAQFAEYVGLCDSNPGRLKLFQ